VTAAYVPDRGDFVWLEFTSQTSSEQAVRRPALVISPKAYNAKVGLALFCPVTSRKYWSARFVKMGVSVQGA
jgi:mRNA interferase MazF